MPPLLNHPKLASAARAAEDGFTLAEAMVTMVILVVGLLMMSSTMANVHRLYQSEQERRSAMNALRSVTEEVQSISAAAALDQETWAQAVVAQLSPTGNLGNTFTVAGLDPVGAGVSVGSLQVFTDETLTDDDIGVPIGMPRDLNANSLTDLDVTADAHVLPVVVNLAWSGAAGSRTLTHGFYVARY